MKKGLRKSNPLYLRASMSLVASCFDTLIKRGVKPHPDDSINKVVERGAEAMAKKLQEIGWLPHYEDPFALLTRLRQVRPALFPGNEEEQPKDTKSGTLEVESDIAEIREEEKLLDKIWESDTPPWEGLPFESIDILKTFINDNPDSDLAKLWNEDDEATTLAFQTLFAQLPDEAWNTLPALRSIKLRTVEYRSFLDGQRTTEKSSN